MLKSKYFALAFSAMTASAACATLTKRPTPKTPGAVKAPASSAPKGTARPSGGGAPAVEPRAEIEVASSIPDVPADGSIVEVATAVGSFATLINALKTVGLDETLSGAGPFTVFAPTDEAFQKLPAGALESLLKDTKKLTEALSLHVVSGRAMASDVKEMTSVTTLEGEALSIEVEGGVRIRKATVVKSDVMAKNGVIHVIDRVLLPE